MRRAKQYQNGYVQYDSRTEAWYFRWRENGRYRSEKIGTRQQYPSKSAAKRAADPMRIEINKEVGGNVSTGEPLTFRKVIDAYIADDLPERHSTRRGYLSKLQLHLRHRWDMVEVASLNPAEVENWLKGLQLSNKSKAHLRSLMRILLDSAMRRGWIKCERNPMELVRIIGPSKKKMRKGITLIQWKGLLAELKAEPMKTLVITCSCLGLRCSELLALKWSDFDWEASTVTIQRGIVEGHVDGVKTSYSHDILPVDPRLAETLLAYRESSLFKSQDDWVFANPLTGGSMPYASRGLQQNWLTPAAVRCGIGRIGWHALRHTYRSLLGDSKTPMDVQKELMRHASITTTMDIYGGALTDSKRQAHSAVVSQLLN